MSDEAQQHYIVLLDDYGHQLQPLSVTHSEDEAKQYVEQRTGWEDLEWENGECEQIEGDVLLFCFGDAQYVILAIQNSPLTPGDDCI